MIDKLEDVQRISEHILGTEEIFRKSEGLFVFK